MTLDAIDLKIFRIPQENNRHSGEKFGQMVGLAPTACQRRLKRLWDEKVIEADLSIVAPRAIGRELMTLVHVTLERERADIIGRFKAAIRVTTEIMTGYYVTGDSDFSLVVTARDMEDFEQFTRRFFDGNPDIRGFKTMVVIDHVKAGCVLPIS